MLNFTLRYRERKLDLAPESLLPTWNLKLRLIIGGIKTCFWLVPTKSLVSTYYLCIKIFRSTVPYQTQLINHWFLNFVGTLQTLTKTVHHTKPKASFGNHYLITFKPCCLILYSIWSIENPLTFIIFVDFI